MASSTATAAFLALPRGGRSSSGVVGPRTRAHSGGAQHHRGLRGAVGAVVTRHARRGAMVETRAEAAGAKNGSGGRGAGEAPGAAAAAAAGPNIVKEATAGAAPDVKKPPAKPFREPPLPDAKTGELNLRRESDDASSSAKAPCTPTA